MDLLKKRTVTNLKRIMKPKNKYHNSSDILLRILADMLIEFQVKRKSDSDIEKETLSNLKDNIVQYCEQLQFENSNLTHVFEDIEEQLKTYQ